MKIGDLVLATDPVTDVTAAKPVTDTIIGSGDKKLVDITIDIDGDRGDEIATVTATDNHPFWVPSLSEWVDAAKLAPQQWLRTSAGTHVQISAIRQHDASTRVHNLTVADIHTYYVVAGTSPVLVHNSNKCSSDLEIANKVAEAHPDGHVREKVITVAVMTTDEGRFAAQAGKTWDEAQLALLEACDVAARPFPGPRYHAEVQLLDFAKNGDLFIRGGLTKRSMAASRPFCGPERKDCRLIIQNAHGKITSPQTAIW